MFEFEFYNPVKAVFGPGKVAQAGVEAAKLGKKAMIVSYSVNDFFKDVLDDVQAQMEKEGIGVVTFYKVEANPAIEVVADGVELCKQENVDFVVGIGGGSAMDAAKAIAAGACYPGEDLWNMVYSRHDDVTAVPPEEALPMLMIPTLPATGSEMNMCSVVSSKALKEKSYIWADCIFPKAAIIDPELTTTLPAFQTACAAADSISHVLEIYINGQDGTPLQHYFQEGVMRTVIENVKIALANPKDIEARGNLQWAATCGLNGWASPGDAWTPIHQVGHVLTSQHGVNHGSSLSALMPSWMKQFNSRRPERYVAFATRVMDVDPAGKSEQEVIDEGIAKFDTFLKEIGVPTTLGEVKIDEGHVEDIIDGVAKVSFGADGYLNCNPRVSREDLKGVLTAAL